MKNPTSSCEQKFKPLINKANEFLSKGYIVNILKQRWLDVVRHSPFYREELSFPATHILIMFPFCKLMQFGCVLYTAEHLHELNNIWLLNE